MEVSKQCPYRKQAHECTLNIGDDMTVDEVNTYCSHCLYGQQNDELGLLSGAIMALIEARD